MRLLQVGIAVKSLGFSVPWFGAAGTAARASCGAWGAEVIGAGVLLSGFGGSGFGSGGFAATATSGSGTGATSGSSFLTSSTGLSGTASAWTCSGPGGISSDIGVGAADTGASSTTIAAAG